MKNSLLAIVVGTLTLGAITTSCSSPEKKVDDARDNLIEAKADLATYIEDSIQTAEWAEFKASAEKKMEENKTDIANLKEKQSRSGAIMDPIYEEQILTLEQRSLALQTRIDDYEKYHSNWSTFKREFNHDLEELGKTLKDVSKNNSK